jgi:hypothetical protein
MPFVDDFARFRFKCCGEQLFHEFDTSAVHGMTCMNGVTVTPLQTPSAT